MAFSAWLSFSLFLLSCAALAHSKSHCPRSSCGSLLQDIRSPFSLRGDPAECGEPQLELVCEGKDAVLYFDSERFFVTHVNYHRQTFRLVYAGFIASSSCLLPNISFHRTPFDDRNDRQQGRSVYPNYYVVSMWATFMNCTEQIHSQEYVAVPCLSGNSSTVYAVLGDESYTLRYLKSSCSFLTTIPAGERWTRSPGLNISQLLRHGVMVHWYFPSWSERSERSERGPSIIGTCWEGTTSFLDADMTVGYRMLRFILFGPEFLECIYMEESYRSHGHTRFRLALVVMVLTFFLLVGRFILAPLSIYAFLAYNYGRNRAPPIDTVEQFLRNQQHSLSPTRYVYNQIVAMTGNFREKLGHGGFGSVFKGQIVGRYPVAVKMLGSSKFNGEDFINEVATIGRIHHVNIVQLLGFCSEGTKRALVYEYMPNGSLDKYIFSSDRTSGCSPFSFDRLTEIALGVARGVDYLHRGCDVQILHFDIKPHNILLDHSFTPKISDFGLAKLYPKDCSLVSVSAARGTIGYIAPELISRSFGAISYKSDVYSFGMLLMEMAGRRRNVDPRAENSSQIYYPSWVYDRLARPELEEPGGEIGDVRMEIDEMERRLSMVGLWCIQMKSCDRPSMSSVVEMLEGDVNDLRLPPKPFLFSSQPSVCEEPCIARSSTGLSIVLEDDALLEPV